MTQAFNLAQLANNLNTSGQLDATDGLYGVLPVANGGIGQSSLTSKAVLIGNGTSGVTSVSPGSSGNILVSDGTNWTSGALSGSTIPNGSITAPKLSGGQSGSAPIFGARAWVNFSNAPGSLGSIRASGNVSSITVNGTADYTVNMTTALPDTDYCVVAAGTRDNDVNIGAMVGTTENGIYNTSSFRITVRNSGNGSANYGNYVFVTVYR